MVFSVCSFDINFMQSCIPDFNFTPQLHFHCFSYNHSTGIPMHINQLCNHIKTFNLTPLTLKLDCLKHDVPDVRSGAVQSKFIIRPDEPGDLSILKANYNTIVEDIYDGKLLNDDNIITEGGAIGAGIQMISQGLLAPKVIGEALKKTENAVFEYCIKN